MRFTAQTMVSLALAGMLVALLAEAGDSVTHRVAFVTSTSYAGNIGGLDDADQACQYRAYAAGLDDWTNFSAWLSDSTTDAYCHVQGQSGTRANNCGLPSLPADDGPWVRVDGSPFAGRIDEMVDPANVVFNPPNLDEYGTAIDSWVEFWSDTSESGALHPSYPTACGDWTSDSASSSAMAGVVSWTSAAWTAEAATCDSSLRLLCVEHGDALPMVPHHSGGALAFLSSAAHTGSLGGLAGADVFCQGLAATAGLPHPDSFVALLSDSSTNAADRLTLDGPWVRVDGIEIAASKSDLFDGSLESAVNVAETGAYFTNWAVWSGSTFNGAGSAAYCSDWTSASSGVVGYAGSANRVNSQWLGEGSLTCDFGSARVYCFSNVSAVVFIDDFESGGASGWSSSVG